MKPKRPRLPKGYRWLKLGEIKPRGYKFLCGFRWKRGEDVDGEVSEENLLMRGDWSYIAPVRRRRKK